MNQKFGESWAVKPDAKRNSTYVGLTIALPDHDFRSVEWEKYYRDCRESLDAVARQHGLKIIHSVIELSQPYTSVEHRVTLGGVLWGTLPLQVMRALRPSRAYRVLRHLESAVRNDWPVELLLRTLVESQRLHVQDRHAKRLPDPIPSQLLMRAITEGCWQGLISPKDNPWAYINTVTQRISARYYETKQELTSVVDASTCDSAEAGTEIIIADLKKPLQSVGISNDAIAVLQAKGQTQRSSQEQAYLADRPANWSHARLAKARRELRTRRKDIRSAVMAASRLKPRSSRALVYKERVPEWGGRWTYAHSFQGEELELMNQIMKQERKNLYKR